MRFDILKSILPDANCKHCYGKGTVGRDVNTDQVILCRCVSRKYREELKKHGQLVLEGKLVHKDGDKYALEGGKLVRR
jgi:hypothetical protein